MEGDKAEARASGTMEPREPSSEDNAGAGDTSEDVRVVNLEELERDILSLMERGGDQNEALKLEIQGLMLKHKGLGPPSVMVSNDEVIANKMAKATARPINNRQDAPSNVEPASIGNDRENSRPEVRQRPNGNVLTPASLQRLPTDMMPQPMPAPDLGRNQNARTTIPGAYPMTTPNGPAGEQEDISSQQDPTPWDITGSVPNDDANAGNQGESNDADLAVADPVPFQGTLVSDDDDQEASAHFVIMAKPLGFLSRWQKPIIACAILAIIIGLVVGITCGSGACSEGKVQLVTQSPTAAPTGSPTASPTANILGTLPQYTLNALADPTTNQSLAYQWVLGDPDHQTYSEYRLMQRFVLAMLYASRNGTLPDYGSNECFWFDVNATKLDQMDPSYTDEACAQDGTIELLVPLHGSVRGKIPPEMGLVTSLLAIDLSDQEISGTIPSSIGDLTLLRDLNLDNLELSSTLPTELGNLASLRRFQMFDGSITGEIPSELGRASGLVLFNLTDGDLEGRVPSEIGLLTNLFYLDLTRNELNSTVPTEIGQCQSLASLNISWNDLTGAIPSEIGHLSNLVDFQIFQNDLSSSIPTEIGELSSIQVFNVENNRRMELGIPTEIGMLSTLKEFHIIDNNNMYGSIPSEIARCSNLEIFRARETKLSFTIPSEIGLLKKLTFFDMLHTAIFGTIPTEVGVMKSLVNFNTRDTTITGPIPSTLGLLKDLNELDIISSLMTGTIPTELALTKLTRLSCVRNFFSGTLPSELGVLTDMSDFNFENNLLTGRLPSELGRYSSNLDFLVLHFNSLTGSIPSEYGLMTTAKKIQLHTNLLTGEIPDFSNFTDRLEKIELSRNINLTGSFPDNVCGIRELSFSCDPDVLCGCWCPCN
ncbi:leucine rich repeat [Seminavis robusta]|uniref:Leucine rich repeat n=1 Tax=Seminavis robusta TaxID=568900 RepID=A0A9N8E3Z7_9STRA|nr:leucine rich repeat [Seminavis robusta]|eukprot:Sro479_g151110.1 leucine rich repeat (881) ;mRNA; f:3194-6536